MTTITVPPTRAIPLNAAAGSVWDPTCGWVATAMLRLVAADPTPVKSTGIGGHLRRIGGLVRLLHAPGRAGVTVDIRVMAGRLRFDVAVHAAAATEADAAADADQLASAALTVLQQPPTIWSFQQVPSSQMAQPTGVVHSVRQQTVHLDTDRGTVTAVVPFDRPLDSGGILPALLAATEDAWVRIGLLATRIDALSLNDLSGQAEVAGRRIDDGPAHDPQVRRAARLLATLHDRAESIQSGVFAADIRIGARQPTDSWLRAITAQLTGHLDLLDLAEHHATASPTVASRARFVGGAALSPQPPHQDQPCPLPTIGHRRPATAADLVTSTEAAALLWPPVPPGQPLPGIPTIPPSNVTITSPVRIGHAPSGEAAFLDLDGTLRIAVTGEPGAGKSLALADLADSVLGHGHRVVALDPHGTLAEHVHAAAVQHGATCTVLSAESPDRLQLLGSPQDPQRLDASISRVVDAICHQWNPDWTGVRFRDLFTAALTALAHIPGAHPFGHLREVFTNDLPHTLPDQVRRTLRSAARASHDDLVGWVASKADVMADTTGRRLIAPVGQPGTHIDTIGHTDATIIALPPAAHTAEQTRLLGTLLLDLAIASLLAAPNGRHTMLIVDEAHLFASPALERALTEGRKFNLSVAIAHHHRHQLPDRLVATIAQTATTHLAFRGSTDLAAQAAATCSTPAIIRTLPARTAVLHSRHANGSATTTTTTVPIPAQPADLPRAAKFDDTLPALADISRRRDATHRRNGRRPVRVFIDQHHPHGVNPATLTLPDGCEAISGFVVFSDHSTAPLDLRTVNNSTDHFGGLLDKVMRPIPGSEWRQDDHPQPTFTIDSPVITAAQVQQLLTTAPQPDWGTTETAKASLPSIRDVVDAILNDTPKDRQTTVITATVDAFQHRQSAPTEPARR